MLTSLFNLILDDVSFAASSSSATSSIVNPSSPKPEKRQANSPLPPPPPPSENVADLYALIDKRNKTEDRIKSTTGKTLDEMYAKVIKKRKDDETCPPEPVSATVFNFEHVSRKHSVTDANHNSGSGYEVAENLKSEYKATTPKPNRSKPETERTSKVEHNYKSTDKRCSVPFQRSTYECDPTYETLPHAKKEPGVLLRNGVDSGDVYSVPFKNRQVHIFHFRS